jgi:hypothetical protein
MARGEWEESSRLIQVATRILRDENPMTIRQAFYRLVSAGYISNNVAAYRRVSRVLTKAREDGRCEIHWVVDRSRQSYETNVFENPREYAEVVKRGYHRDYWQDQPVHVEIWTEKDAITGSIMPVQDELGVPIRPCRGYNSTTVAMEMAGRLASISKKKIVFYLGDHDGSGHAPVTGIQDELKSRVLRYGSGPFELKRLAILPEDIQKFNLPPQRVKDSDPRAVAFRRKFGTKTVELDALPPTVLRRRLTVAIKRVMDRRRWNRAIEVERVEIACIAETVGKWFGS